MPKTWKTVKPRASATKPMSLLDRFNKLPMPVQFFIFTAVCATVLPFGLLVFYRFIPFAFFAAQLHALDDLALNPRFVMSVFMLCWSLPLLVALTYWHDVRSRAAARKGQPSDWDLIFKHK